MKCGLVEASCECIEPKDHDGPHVCDCGGSWDFTEDGEFVAVTLPGSAGPLEVLSLLSGLGF